MSKKPTPKDKAKEKEEENKEMEKLIEEFKPKKQEILDKMITGLLLYVKESKMPKSKTSYFMDCYNLIYNYTDRGLPEYLLKFHNEIIQQAVTDCYKKLKDLSNMDFIDNFISCTERLNTLIYTMSRIFLYLSRNYIENSDNKDNEKKLHEGKNHISQFSMDIFKKDYFDKLERKVFNYLNEILIREERNGNKEHRLKITYIMKLLSYLDFQMPEINKESSTKIYWEEKGNSQNKIHYQSKWYNDYFKEETIKYIKNKSERDIKNNSAPEYVKCELKYIKEEEEREKEYINQTFHPDIDNINYEYLIKNNMNQLVEMDTGVNYMFQTKKKDELSEIFQLFKYFPESLKLIQKSFRADIKERLTKLFDNKELSRDPKKFIPALINLKKDMDEILILCFEHNNEFEDEENKEFSVLMKKDFYPKQLANYSDFCMRAGFKGKSEKEIDNILNDIISLFKNISSKLVFQIEYAKKMSERLIKGSSYSMNAEKSLISKLKQESGVTYVSKMNEMISDLEKNNKETDLYKQSKSKGNPNGIKFDVKIISQSAWEVSKTNMEKIELFPFLKVCIEDFQTFYCGRHQQTKLLWCYGLSKLDIQYLYLNNKNISTSTLLQVLALLYLEKYENLTLEKIANLLGCSVNKVISDIKGLIFNPSFNQHGQIDKGVILSNVDPKTKEFKPSTEITINKNFSVTHKKFNTLPLPQKKTEAEIKASEAEEAQITKRYQDNILQATITRIMKSRIGQDTSHVWLVGEASKQVDLFKAQPQQIKENIEKLIEKNVVKRAGAKYEYIA